MPVERSPIEALPTEAPTAARPRIGISCDLEERNIRGVTMTHSVLSDWYAEAVRRAGGLPIVLPSAAGSLAGHLAGEYVALLDGIVLSGGDFDIDPAHYGEAPHDNLGRIVPTRTGFEWALFSAAEAKGLAILGVCGGMQLINVARGGALFQDLPTQRPSDPSHSQLGDKQKAWHQVSVIEGGTLAKIVGHEPLGVNSTHHQAVKSLGKHLEVEAVAHDGLIEAFSDRRKPFLLGVQWHPEAMVDDDRQQAIYRALVSRASTAQ